MITIKIMFFIVVFYLVVSRNTKGESYPPKKNIKKFNQLNFILLQFQMRFDPLQLSKGKTLVNHSFDVRNAAVIGLFKGRD